MNIHIKPFEKPEDENGGGLIEQGRDIAETMKHTVISKPREIRGDEGSFVNVKSADSPKPTKKKVRAADNNTAWYKVSPMVAVLISVLITLIVVVVAVNFAVNKFFRPVDANDPTPIVVEIPKGSGASAIAKILYEAGGEGEKGLISNKAVFKVYVDFLGKSSGLKAGTYVLSRNMDIGQITDISVRAIPREIRSSLPYPRA